MTDLEEQVNNMTLDGGMLHGVFHRMAQDHRFENGFGYAARFSALNRSFHAKFARLARRHQRLVVVCERENWIADENAIEPIALINVNAIQVGDLAIVQENNIRLPQRDADNQLAENADDENISLDSTQASDDERDEEGECIMLNENRFHDLRDAAGMLRFMYLCGTQLDEVDLTRFTPRQIPNGCKEIIEALSLFRTVKSMEFGDWDSKGSRCIAEFFGSTHSALRRLTNVPVDGFCRFKPSMELEFLQIHAKLLRYSYGYDWKHGDGVYVFEAAEKLEELVSNGTKCKQLVVVGFNNVRRHPTYTLLIQQYGVRRIEFINEHAQVFSEELRWFIDWHSEGAKFPDVDEVVIELDDVLRDLQDRIRITVDLVSSVFPNCRSLEIRHHSVTAMATVLQILNAWEYRHLNPSFTLLLNFVISVAESGIEEQKDGELPSPCGMFVDGTRVVTLDRCSATLVVSGRNVEIACRIE